MVGALSTLQHSNGLTLVPPQETLGGSSPATFWPPTTSVLLSGKRVAFA